MTTSQEHPSHNPSNPSTQAKVEWSHLLDNILQGNMEELQQNIRRLFTDLIGGFLPSSWLKNLGLTPTTPSANEEEHATSTPTAEATSHAKVETITTSQNGKKVMASAQKFLGMPYKFAGRPAAKDTHAFQKNKKGAEYAPGKHYNGGGIDCSGLWWAVWRDIGFTDKHGKPLSNVFFSKDGLTGMLPALSDSYDSYQLGANVSKALKVIKNYPPGSLIAFGSHVGIVGENGFLNAQGGIRRDGSSFGKGVVEGSWEETFRYFAGKGGLTFRVLKPEHLQIPKEA